MEITQADVYRLAPYAETLGVLFEKIAEDVVVARVEPSHAHSTVGGGMHGGVLMALGDIVAAVLCTAATSGGLPATLQSSTNFLSPVRGVARATAVPLRVGKSTLVVAVTVADENDVVAVHMMQTISYRSA